MALVSFRERATEERIEKGLFLIVHTKGLMHRAKGAGGDRCSLVVAVQHWAILICECVTH